MKKVIAFAVTLCIFQLIVWTAIRFDVETLLVPPDAVLPDGSRYYGDLLDGRFQGKGKITRSDGSRYEGEFVNGLMSGKGELHYSTGDVYVGDFKDGLMSGQGELRLAEGSVYSGAFADGLPNGKGTLKNKDGTEYKGEFRQWKFHGKGTYTTAAGEEYTGDFVENKFTGNGIYKNPATGNSYEGQFRNWKFHGHGAYVVKDQGRYRGNFEDGILNGKGSYKSKGGDRYEGEFKKGIYNGLGTLIQSDGERYTGEFEDGEYNGKGVLTRANGDRYSGEFEYGLFDGKGELVFAKPADGVDKQSGEWEYGEFQDPQAKEKEALLQRQMEQALFNQERLLHDAAQKIAPGIPGTIELYFVGLAGYGEQDVFMKELGYIRELMDTRFKTAGHSAVLINNPKTLETAPLATRTGLERMLRAVAEKMNPDEDILFLYLTSHGSKEHKFSIRHPGVELPDLTSDDLASILGALPVKWKVIVISACYSGGFIPPLENANSLIMTAARADRKSFGCSDTSEMTWFAKAYFKESLPQATSFEQAFENSRKLIAEWEVPEIKQGAEHSEPQISAGAAISAQLQKWWQTRQPAEEKKEQKQE